MDDTSSDTPKSTLPQFTPVPRLAERSNGWKPEVQRAFIEALAETGSVRSACRRVGRSDHGAYLLRRHPEAEEFRAAWQAALDIGMQRIEDVAMDRAINGTEEPVYSYGKLVGTRVKYNDRLLMFMLRNRSPERFTGGRPLALNAADQGMLKRLKKQWHEEWEREHAIRHHQDEQEVLESIDTFLEDMRQRREANMSPRARAAYAEAARIHQEDGVEWMLRGNDAQAEDETPRVKLSDVYPDWNEEPEEPEVSSDPRIRTLREDGWR